jgi:hypothetical protein
MAVEKLRFEFDGDASKFQSAVNKSQKSVNNFSTSLKQVGGIIAGAFAIDKLMEFGGAVVETTSTFQRFESVLTNTLGSQSEAQKALDRITEFASQTPFSVAELTDSFVRLANQGFIPTSEEMRKLGDLASSTGKDFVQLTEAVIDAQVGEFERLKEFGIRASKQGDQVKFTFKGVETQVKFTADAINDYVLSLGDLEGVSGAMVGISKTLGGQISNLGDSFDSLKNEIGEALMPILTSAIGAFKNLFENITRLLNPQKALLSDFKATKKELDEMNSSTEKLVGNDLKLFNLRKKFLEQDYLRLEKEINLEIEKSKENIEDENLVLQKLISEEAKLTERLNKQTEAWTANNKEVAKTQRKLDGYTIAISEQQSVIEEAKLKLDSFKASLENILNPLEDTSKITDLVSSSFISFNLETKKTQPLLTEINNSLGNTVLMYRKMLPTVVDTAKAQKQLGMITNMVTTGMNLMFDALSSPESFNTFLKGIKQVILQLLKQLIIMTAISAIFAQIRGAGSFADIFKSLTGLGKVSEGFSLFGKGKIPKLAHGGIVTKPTMGIVGEAGQSEAIIPLNRLPQLMGAMGSNQRGEFTLRGQDLILALERAGDFRTRVTG